MLLIVGRTEHGVGWQTVASCLRSLAHWLAPPCPSCPTPTLLCPLPLAQVAPFSSARELSFAASSDASLVAWVDAGRLWLKWQDSGAVHPIWPRPANEHPLLQQQRLAAQQAAIASGALGGSSGGSGNGPPLEVAPWIDRGSVLAMQWSPDGRRLLFLLHAGPSRKLAAAGEFASSILCLVWCSKSASGVVSQLLPSLRCAPRLAHLAPAHPPHLPQPWWPCPSAPDSDGWCMMPPPPRRLPLPRRGRLPTGWGP